MFTFFGDSCNRTSDGLLAASMGLAFSALIMMGKHFYEGTANINRTECVFAGTYVLFAAAETALLVSAYAICNTPTIPQYS